MHFSAFSMWLGSRNRLTWNFVKISLNSVCIAAVPARIKCPWARWEPPLWTQWNPSAPGTSPNCPSAVTAVTDTSLKGESTKLKFLCNCGNAYSLSPKVLKLGSLKFLCPSQVRKRNRVLQKVVLNLFLWPFFSGS